MEYITKTIGLNQLYARRLNLLALPQRQPQQQSKLRQLTLTGLIAAALVFSTSSYAALSATTAKTIQGTGPLFVTTGANAVDLTEFKFFGLSYGGTDYYTQAQLNTILSPLNLSPRTTKPADLYGSTTPAYPLTLSPLGMPIAAEVIDNDGDTLSTPPLAELTTGSVTLGWYYGAGNGTQLSAAELNQNFCALAAANKAPYLKVSGGIKLSTIYGDPNSQPYPDAALGLTTPLHKFTIPFSPDVCGALPNKSYNTATYIGAPEWDTTFGFLPQPAGTDNFPTTGANGLYFDLIIGGIDATTLDWPGYPLATPAIPALTDKGVTVTVTNVTASNVTVKLTGPVASSTAAGATAPAFDGSPTTPASFTVQGLQGATPVISYAFGIKRWYVNRGNVSKPATSTVVGADTQTNWCANLSGANYVLPAVNELTNAQGNAGGSGGVIPPSPFPNTNNTNNYQRRIGGGLFTEWGGMPFYTGASFVSGNSAYWTTDTNGTYQLAVLPYRGDVNSGNPSYIVSAVCASRP